MSPQYNRKLALGQWPTSKNRVTSISCTLEPAIWSRDACQQIPCFDRCQLIITWMFNIKEVHCKPRLQVSVNLHTCIHPSIHTYILYYGSLIQGYSAIMQISNYYSNWTEWSTIQGVIARVISKSDEREARGRFEITSTITP